MKPVLYEIQCHIYEMYCSILHCAECRIYGIVYCGSVRRYLSLIYIWAVSCTFLSLTDPSPFHLRNLFSLFLIFFNQFFFDTCNRYRRNLTVVIQGLVPMKRCLGVK